MANKADRKMLCAFCPHVELAGIESHAGPHLSCRERLRSAHNGMGGGFKGWMAPLFKRNGSPGSLFTMEELTSKRHPWECKLTEEQLDEIAEKRELQFEIDEGED